MINFGGYLAIQMKMTVYETRDQKSRPLELRIYDTAIDAD